MLGLALVQAKAILKRGLRYTGFGLTRPQTSAYMACVAPRVCWTPSWANISGNVDQKMAALGCVIRFHLQPIDVDLSHCLNLEPDRKSTRLNSSHLGISYAVF